MNGGPATPRERWLAGVTPAGAEEKRRHAEYEACASDADRAYAAMKRAFGGHPGSDFEAALFAELDAAAKVTS